MVPMIIQLLKQLVKFATLVSPQISLLEVKCNRRPDCVYCSTLNEYEAHLTQELTLAVIHMYVDWVLQHPAADNDFVKKVFQQRSTFLTWEIRK